MRNIWLYGQVVTVVPFHKMSDPKWTDGDQNWTVVSQVVQNLQSKSGITPASGLDAVPRFSGDGGRKFEQALNFVMRQQSLVKAALEAQYGKQAGDLSTLTFATHMLNVASQLGKPKLTGASTQ